MTHTLSTNLLRLTLKKLREHSMNRPPLKSAGIDMQGIRALCFFLLAAFAHIATAESRPTTGSQLDTSITQEIKASNLENTKVKGFDDAQITPNATFKGMTTYYVEPPTIEFDKRWKRDVRFDMTDRDEQRILTHYSESLVKALHKTLQKKTPLKAVQKPADASIIITPALTRFRITAPDLSLASRTKNYVDYVGSARVHFTLKQVSTDGTHTVLAQLKDHDLTRSFNGIMELKKTNRIENYRDFKNLFQRWAGKLSRFLNTQLEA